MSQREAFERVVAALQETALDDALWPATSALIDDACGASGNTIIVSEGSDANARVLFAMNYRRGERREDLERDYFQNYFPHDERVPRLRQLPDSKLVHVADLYTAEERKTSPTFNEALPRYGSRNSLCVRLSLPGGLWITWAIADPVKPGAWASDQRDMIKRLLPHLRHFVRFRQALADAETLGSSLAGLLSTSRLGVVSVDRRGKILAANGRARAVLRQGSALRDQGGFLGARSPTDAARLERLVARALPQPDRPLVSGTLTVRRRHGLSGLTVHVNPLTTHLMDFGGSGIAALVLLADPEVEPSLDAQVVASALNLTPAQGQVALSLARGQTLSEIAAATGRGENTVRTHRAGIYRRLGISSRAELVQVVEAVGEFLPPRD